MGQCYAGLLACLEKMAAMCDGEMVENLMHDPFKEGAFDVENALMMYATSFVTMPAFGIYEDALIAPLLDQIKNCHIYIIGLTPKTSVVNFVQRGQLIVASINVAGDPVELTWDIPEGAELKGDGEEGWYVEDRLNRRFFPSEESIALKLSSELGVSNFEVLYVGQAYGNNGSRNALDRLLEHKTLQKIAVRGVPDNYNLTILMLAIEPSSRIFTVFNPRAKDSSQGTERIRNGIDKLFNTSEAERTTLYEASLIRYFQPRYNKEFKDSFPSTNMKLLADCYEKDFAALVAEVCFDELPFQLFSELVPPSAYHIAKHDLHSDKDRKIFFR